MIEILGIVLASIVAVILIMALIGYFMEKNQNKKGRNSTSLGIAPTNIGQVNSTSVNNVPLNNIPVDNTINNNLINNNIPVDNTINNGTVISNGEIKENENSVMNQSIPSVLNFNEISNDLEKKENNNFNMSNNI